MGYANVSVYVVVIAVMLYAGEGKVNPRALPTGLIVLNILTAVGYAMSGGPAEWRKIVYWLAASVYRISAR